MMGQKSVGILFLCFSSVVFAGESQDFEGEYWLVNSDRLTIRTPVGKIDRNKQTYRREVRLETLEGLLVTSKHATVSVKWMDWLDSRVDQTVATLSHGILRSQGLGVKLLLVPRLIEHILSETEGFRGYELKGWLGRNRAAQPSIVPNFVTDISEFIEDRKKDSSCSFKALPTFFTLKEALDSWSDTHVDVTVEMPSVKLSFHEIHYPDRKLGDHTSIVERGDGWIYTQYPRLGVSPGDRIKIYAADADEDVGFDGFAFAPAADPNPSAPQWIPIDWQYEAYQGIRSYKMDLYWEQQKGRVQFRFFKTCQTS